MRLSVVICLALLMTATSSEVGASPIVGASANTLPEGKLMLDCWFLWRDFAWEYENSSDSWSTLKEERELTAATFMPRVYYGLSDWVTIRAGIPVEDRYRSFEDLDDSRTSTGLGDFVFDPKIMVYEADGGSPRVSALMGVRVPTGDTESDIPLSDGSTDVLLGAAASHRAGDFAGHVCLTHWFNGENNEGVDVRDLWIGTLTLESLVDERWSLLWEAKAYVSSETRNYRRVYACPGISWTGERVTAGLSAMISAYRKGDTAISSYDFDWAPFMRVYYRFF